MDIEDAIDYIEQLIEDDDIYGFLSSEIEALKIAVNTMKEKRDSQKVIS